MKKKALLTISSSIFALFAIVGFAGCGKEEDKDKYDLTMDSGVSVVLEETYNLNAKVNGENQEGIAFTSANPEIVTVSENGLLTGVSCGETTVTATYEGNSATATVTVGLGDNVPMLQMNSVSGSELQVSWLDEIDLSASILYNGKTYDDCTLTYTVDETKATVTNGIFKAKTAGESKVTLSAEWKNVPIALTKVITINAISNAEISINKGQLNGAVLYSSERLGDKTFTQSLPLDILAEIDGEEVEYSMEILKGAECISIDSGILTAKKVGEVEIRVSATNSQGMEFTESAAFTVEKPFLSEVKALTTKFDTATGKFGSVSEIFGYETTIIEAYENGEPLTVEDGEIKGLQINADGSATEKTLLVYDEFCGYTVSFTAYSSVKILAPFNTAEAANYAVKHNATINASQAQTYGEDAYSLHLAATGSYPAIFLKGSELTITNLNEVDDNGNYLYNSISVQIYLNTNVTSQVHFQSTSNPKTTLTYGQWTELKAVRNEEGKFICVADNGESYDIFGAASSSSTYPNIANTSATNIDGLRIRFTNAYDKNNKLDVFISAVRLG